MSEQIVVSIIGAVVALMIEVMRRQNKRQHAEGYGLLESIDRRTERIDDRLDEHGERLTVLETHHADTDASFRRPDIQRRRAHREGGTR